MRRIVVDACVTVAAGTGLGKREPAPEAISMLAAILERGRRENDLRLAMNGELEAEWTAGEGQYAMIWLAEMVSRRLVDQVETAWPEEADLLRHANANHRAPISKDIHLIRLAMVTERRLVTLERKLPRYLGLTLTRTGKPECLRLLHVVNPVVPGACAWIAAGAPDDQSWCM